MSRLSFIPLSLLIACSAFHDLDGFSSAGGEEPGRDAGADGTAPHRNDEQRETASFSLSVSVGSVYVDPGEQNVVVPIRLSRASGFTSPVVVTLNGLPSAVRASGLTLTGADESASVLLGADSVAAAGGAKITIVGTAGDESATASFSLFVTGRLLDLDADRSLTLPAIVPPTLDLYVWGAGGGGAPGGRLCGDYPGATDGGDGGAGGGAVGRIAVAPEDTLEVRVGAGGAEGRSRLSGAGGGYSGVRRGAGWLLIAGGGGGGGYGNSDGLNRFMSGTNGGAGGGAVGAAASGSTPAARGGSATAGGESSWCTGDCPGAGTSLLGGEGQGTTSKTPAGGAPGGGGAGRGAGGGGGFFGGGGGGVRSSNYVEGGLGGGGGSGFADASVLPIEGEAVLFAGKGRTPPLTESPFYVSGAAVGGAAGRCNGGAYQDGGPSGGGRVVIVLSKP